MARHIRIPLIADLILTDDADEIGQLADHAALDRGFRPRGPLINRILAHRVRSALSLGGNPLPSAMMRDDPERRRMSQDIADKFAPGNWDTDTLTQMVGYVRGDLSRPVGELAQQITGRVFDPTYAASAETWDAAKAIETHLQSFNPLRRLIAFLSGALRDAQGVLGQAAKGDKGAVHGTGIAVHNLALSLERLQAAWADQRLRAHLTPEQAALRVIAAPRTVMRAGKRQSDTIGGRVRPVTLVAMNTRRAAGAGMDADLAFLGSSWSRCPAQHWVMALLAEIWKQAGEPG